ncbi:MAG: hypothetical protein AAF823_15995 [Planctomycetota bacterium]
MSGDTAPPPDSDHPSKPRPAWLRAMGRLDPPTRVEVGGRPYTRVTLYKHDAWAATCQFAAEDDPDARAIVKFSRRSWLGPIPMGWVGRGLTRRETRLLHRLADVQGVPDDLGPVAWTRPGHAAPTPDPATAARVFLDGDTLKAYRETHRVSDTFFEELDAIVAALHDADVAYVDMDKSDNVIVGTDGRPKLIDFQIHFAIPRRLPLGKLTLGWLLRTLQRSDRYHLMKHKLRTRPDLYPGGEAELDALRPPAVRLWRRLSKGPQRLRRALLTKLGVRDKTGRAASEYGA